MGVPPVLYATGPPMVPTIPSDDVDLCLHHPHTFLIPYYFCGRRNDALCGCYELPKYR